MPARHIKRFLTIPGRGTTAIDPYEHNDSGRVTAGSNDLELNIKDPVSVTEESLDKAVPDESLQNGVAVAEAMTLTWAKQSLVCAYILMFLLYFVNAFQSSITSNLSAYITSGFETHSLVSVISVVSSVMSAATYMPVAKILNLWDRSVGFALMAALATLGLVLSATCSNLATYCAAQVFYSVGFGGMIFCIDVITADTSKLRNRGLAYAFTSSPYIITAFAGPSASQRFYESNWRWGFGVFAVILPIVALPMFGLLQFNLSKARKSGLLARPRSERTWLQSVKHYAIEFDILGIFLMTAGLVLFLLPFNIAGSSEDDWRTGYIITMLVVGIVLLAAFAAVERYFAPKPFLPWNLLSSRTILGVCLLDFCYQVAYYCWNDYYTSYLQVVYGTSIEVAGYINSVFDVVSGIWLIVVGLLIKRTGRFRWLFYFSVPLYMLGVGLMIYFRRPDFSVGYSVMCQVFIALGGGTMIIAQQVGILAAGTHDNAASLLALLSVAGWIGGAVGSAISGAVWTHTLPGALQRLLPEEALADWSTIYDSLDVQLSYERGSDIRDAIVWAYAEAQTRMLIAGTAIMALSLIWMFLIRDIKLTKDQQAKGTVF